MRVALHNIGPIRDADVDLDGLSVLVGPNGSGKTILSSVAYAANLSTNHALRRANLNLGSPLSLRGDTLDEIARRAIERWEEDMRNSFESELRRCCARDLSKLGRERRGGRGAAPRLSISEGSKSDPLWRLVFRLQEGRLVVERANDLYVRSRFNLEGVDLTNSRRVRDRFLKQMRRSVPTRSVYFPASRSGFMQTYGALTSLVWGALGGGYFEQATVGPIPGTAADFLQFLAQLRPERESPIGESAAAQIETELLDGELKVVSGDGAPQQVLFHPNGLSQSWAIEESATSTAELAPLALYLRHQAQSRDSIFIDEPEAHLHPSNQVALASALANVASVLQSVMIATHSEFLVSEISNLTMEGQLSLMDEEPISRRLNIYEFSRSNSRPGVDVRPLTVDPDRGFEIDQFAAVADATYERAVQLFNRLSS